MVTRQKESIAFYEKSIASLKRELEEQQAGKKKLQSLNDQVPNNPLLLWE